MADILHFVKMCLWQSDIWSHEINRVVKPRCRNQANQALLTVVSNTRNSMDDVNFGDRVDGEILKKAGNNWWYEWWFAWVQIY